MMETPEFAKQVLTARGWEEVAAGIWKNDSLASDGLPWQEAALLLVLMATAK